MDVRITPSSTLITPRKTSTQTNYYYGRNRTQFDKSKHTIPTIQAKIPHSVNNNNFLILSKKNTNKPQFSIKITSSMIQPPSVADKSGVLLYQQIERNKSLSNGAELINRFNYKV